MIKVKIFTIMVFFKSLISPYHMAEENHPEKNHPKYKVKKVERLTEKVNESSAIIRNPIDSSSGSAKNSEYSFWTLNDHGGKAELYEILLNSSRQPRTWKIKNASNFDWEELTKDKEGNIFIGDFGNNFNSRRNLKIYKVNPSDSLKTDSILFSFSDQKEFPPPANELNFDCEAFFWYNDSLYLFSKNRGDGPMKVYRLPDKPGIYTAELIKEINIKGMITAADISPDYKQMVLLSYGKIYFFNLSEEGSLKVKSSYCKKIPRGGQSEGICFIDNSDLAITNEQRKLFFVKRKK